VPPPSRLRVFRGSSLGLLFCRVCRSASHPPSPSIPQTVCCAFRKEKSHPEERPLNGRSRRPPPTPGVSFFASGEGAPHPLTSRPLPQGRKFLTSPNPPPWRPNAQQCRPTQFAVSHPKSAAGPAFPPAASTRPTPDSTLISHRIPLCRHGPGSSLSGRSVFLFLEEAYVTSKEGG